jgi:hypothetical protein
MRLQQFVEDKKNNNLSATRLVDFPRFRGQ